MKVSAKYIPCDCGGRAVKQTAPAKFKKGRSNIVVENIPAFVCENCGEFYFDGPSILKIERKLEKQAALT